MKKIIILILFMMILTFSVYALHDSHLNLGFSYLNLHKITGDSIQPAGGDIGMMGLGINQYVFWNGMNLGLFAHSNFLLAVYLTNEFNLFSFGSKYIDMTIGTGFRHNLNSRLV